jgi:hypothetical protein
MKKILFNNKVVFA